MIIKAYAKINLTLEIKNKLNNGYHTIDSIMQKINLFDKLYIKNNINNNFILNGNSKNISYDNNNLIYKAYMLLKE